MLYKFSPQNSRWFRGSDATRVSVEIGSKKLSVTEPNELTGEEAAAVESLYPGSLEAAEEEKKPKSSTKSTTKSAAPTNADRNQVIDQLKAGGLELEDLTAILDQYPGDKEIAKLAETAMGTL